MTESEIYEGCIAVYAFLIDKKHYGNLYESKELIRMNECLSKHNLTMTDFTEYLNEKFSLGYTLVDKNGFYKTFFDNHGKQMYKSLIRTFKIKKLYN